jgi:hypothetical protein
MLLTPAIRVPRANTIPPQGARSGTADNLSAHQTAKVLAFVEAHPNVQLH